jgi:hypothetical protein
MRSLLTIAVAVAALVGATNANAAGPVLLVQDAQPIAPMPEPGMAPQPANGAAVPLFHCVKYKDEKNIAPCAVPMVVTVKDPCPQCCDPCNCCAPKCVAVQICVPPCTCCPPKVTCKNGGEYVKYDFGKYRVEITSRKGVVTVDYDD